MASKQEIGLRIAGVLVAVTTLGGGKLGYDHFSSASASASPTPDARAAAGTPSPEARGINPTATVTAIARATGTPAPDARAATVIANLGTCTVGARIESYKFFDMAGLKAIAEFGFKNVLDYGIDPRAGGIGNFTIDAVPLTYQKGDYNKPDYKPLASTNIILDKKADVGRGELSFQAPCNTTTVTGDGIRVPAVEYKVISSLDPSNDQVRPVTGNGRRSVIAVGSQIKKPADFLALAASGMVNIQDYDDKKKALIEAEAKE